MSSEHWAIAKAVIAAATEAQKRCIQYSNAMDRTNQCEVCGSTQHRTYNCCEQCNIDRHTCHFCGDNLGHAMVSACYHLMHVEEGRIVPDIHMLQMWLQQAT